MLGELQGSRALNGNVCSWQTASLVDTPIGPLIVDFQAGSDGPTEKQFELWNFIVGNLEKLRTETYPFLAGWLEQLDPTMAPEDLGPKMIYVWDAEGSDSEWSMVFEHPPKLWEFTVTFERESAEHTDFDRLG